MHVGITPRPIRRVIPMLVLYFVTKYYKCFVTRLLNDTGLRPAVAMDSRRIIAVGLARLRRERGYTQAELAERAGLSLQFLAAIEQGNKAPRFDNLDALCSALQVSPSVLFAAGEDSSAPAKAPSTKLQSAIAALPRDRDDDMTEVIYAIARTLAPRRARKPRAIAPARGRPRATPRKA